MIAFGNENIPAFHIMLLRFSIFAILLLGSCDTAEDEPSWLTQPTDDAPIIPIPTPIVSQQEFLDLFTDLCLVSPSYLSSFQKAAKRYRLSQTINEPESHGYSSYQWQSPEREPIGIALEVRVGTADSLIEFESGYDRPADLPSRGRSCSITAHLNENDPESQRALKKTVEEDLQPVAKSLDFSTYAKNYQVTPSDIRLELSLSEKSAYTDLRPSSSCPRGAPCWITLPYKLTLDVVLERSP